MMPFRQVQARVLSGFATLLLASCSSSTSSGPTGTTVYTCTADADCKGIGFVCDKTRLQCVCTSDAMCASNHAAPYCNVFTGDCVAQHNGCTEASCPQGQYCDESVRECTALVGYCGSCTSDAQCGPNNNCVVHPDFPGTPMFCASACSSASDAGTDGGAEGCGSGQECVTVASGSKQCVPMGQLCSGGSLTCVPDALTPCMADADCTATTGQKCDTTHSVCVAATSTCSPGQSCDPRSMTCVLACQTDPDCVARYGSGFECLQHICVPQGECTKDSECTSDQFCLMPPGMSGVGQCTATCTKNSDCPLDQACVKNATTGRNNCAPGCSADTECLPTELCVNGACESGHCQTSAVCPFDYSCTNNACVKQAGQCTSCNNGCALGGFCAGIFFCCSGSACPTATGVTCGQVNFCPGQTTCSMNRCLMPCHVDADCSNGFTCEAISGQSGAYCQPLVADGQNCVNP